jgi:hypothetical protein
VLLVGACGSDSSGATGPGTVSTARTTKGAAGDPATAAATEGEPLTSWTVFGLNAQRSDATNQPTGITAANVGGLKDRQIKLPGTIDSSPIYLHDATVGGSEHDVVMRVLALGRLDGHKPGGKESLGGEVQTLETSGDTELFTQPAVWKHGTQTTVFVGDFSATAAFALRGRKLQKLWENGTPGRARSWPAACSTSTNPKAAGSRSTNRARRSRPPSYPVGAPGHWNSPIVVDGHVIEPEGDANDHSGEGTIDILRLP